MIHLFEINEENSIYSLNHTYGKGSSWQTETIYSNPDYFIFWFDVKRKIYKGYDQYYVLYCTNRSVDGTSYSNIKFQTKQVSTGIEDNNDLTVKSYSLEQNYPNPFNSQTEISYTLQNNCEVRIDIFNAKGEFIKNLINKKQSKGKHTIVFDAGKFNSGIYYYQLEVDGKIIEASKMLYLK